MQCIIYGLVEISSSGKIRSRTIPNHSFLGTALSRVAETVRVQCSDKGICFLNESFILSLSVKH